MTEKTQTEAIRLRRAQELIDALSGTGRTPHVWDFAIDVEGAPRVTVSVETDRDSARDMAPDVMADIEAQIVQAVATDLESYDKLIAAASVWKAISDAAAADALTPRSDDQRQEGES